MNLKQRVGKRIQELRNIKGLKQSELAELVNIATKTQSCIETGRNLPSAELLENYARVFQIDESELLDISSIKSSDILLNEIKQMLNRANEKEINLIHKILKGIIY